MDMENGSGLNITPSGAGSDPGNGLGGQPAPKKYPTDLDLLRDFFNLTGGSIFYCISAVLVAYGVVKLLGPVLSDTETILAAIPCVGTLAI